MKNFILICLSVGLTFTAFSQSNALKRELDTFQSLQQDYRGKVNEAYKSDGEVDPKSIPYPNSLTKGFFYPSVIRTLNIGNEPVINEFSKTIDLLIIGRCDNMTTEEEQALFKRMTTQLKTDQYEVWIEMEGSERAALLVEENDGLISSFVLLVDSSEYGGLLILDYAGEMTPELLFKLKNIDIDKLTESLNNSMLKNFLDL